METLPLRNAPDLVEEHFPVLAKNREEHQRGGGSNPARKHGRAAPSPLSRLTGAPQPSIHIS